MPTRTQLHHSAPSFVPDGAWFFITICCVERGFNQLCGLGIATKLLEDAAIYHRERKWVLQVFLLMPDHLHAIAAFPAGAKMAEIIRHWKRLTARRAGIRWQRNFFDHRLRPGEGLPQKAEYIRQNPVRAGLVERAEDWPHFIDFQMLEGR